MAERMSTAMRDPSIDRMREAVENGYATAAGVAIPTDRNPGFLAIVESWGDLGAPPRIRQERHPTHKPTLHRDPMTKPTGIDPTLIASGPHGSGRADVGAPTGLWGSDDPDHAIARPAGWQPRPAWDAIEAKPTPTATWTVEGWRV
jgi:hypothetical protein